MGNGGRRLRLIAAATGLLLGPTHSAAAAGQDTRAADSSAPQVSGTILDRPSGEPIATARIALLDRVTGVPIVATVSDTLGGFTLPPALPGVYGLSVEAPGYRTVRDSLTLVEGEDEALTIYMVGVAIDLESLVVTASRTTAFYMRDFERRRALGNGIFITRDQIERRQGGRTSEILQSLGGVRVRYGWQGTATLFVRGTCRPQIFVDGIAIHEDVSVDLAALPVDIEGMEVYSTAAIPVQYASGGACAVILIWTRPAVRGDEKRKTSWWKLGLSAGVLLTFLILGR